MVEHALKKTALLTMAAVMAMGITTSTYAADDASALRKEIQHLNQRVTQLEQQLLRRDSFDEMDPFMEMNRMQRHMMRMMSDNHDYFNPRIDVKESPKQYIITMDIPGMDKNNIEVNVKEGNLIVSGERSSVQEKSEDKYFHQERSFGHFVRAVPLPKDADTSSIDAQYDSGVLTIKVNRLAKVNAAEGKKIAVK